MGVKNKIAKLYYYVRGIAQTVLSPILYYNRPAYNKKYDLAICGIFKDEARFLKEWITYHQLVGIQHFYLYNNNSTDNYADVLKSFIDDDIVTLIEWPYEQGQITAYKNFYDRFRHETQWVSFLDIDEFFVPKKDISLLDWIKKHDKAPVLQVYWKMFGSSGVLEHDDIKLVTEQYQCSWPTLVRCGKCFINTDYQISDFDASTLHSTKVYSKINKRFRLYPLDVFGTVNVNKPEKLLSKKYTGNSDIQINHYWSKGWDVYDRKRRRVGDGCFANNPKNNLWYFLKHELNNTSQDMNIWRFILPLKWKMYDMPESIEVDEYLPRNK